MRTYCIRVVSRSNVWLGRISGWGHMARKTMWRQIGENDMWRWRHRLEWCIHKPKIANHHQELETGLEQILPQGFQSDCGPDDPLISDSSIQKCKRINFFCFQSPSSWQFVTTTLGNEHSVHLLEFIQYSLYMLSSLTVTGINEWMLTLALHSSGTYYHCCCRYLGWSCWLPNFSSLGGAKGWSTSKVD